MALDSDVVKAGDMAGIAAALTGVVRRAARRAWLVELGRAVVARRACAGFGASIVTDGSCDWAKLAPPSVTSRTSKLQLARNPIPAHFKIGIPKLPIQPKK
jgi:hypothetical protein